MIQALHIDDNARREFTDRQAPLKVLEDALAEPQAHNRHRIRVWYGVGGQGKTALLNKFHREISLRKGAQRVTTTVLDFDNVGHRNPIDALLSIRRQLGRRISFTTFDVAFDLLFKLDRPGGAEISAAYPDVYGRHQNEIAEFLEGLGEYTMEVPWVGLIYKFSRHLTGPLQKWWNTRGVMQQVGDLEKCTAIELREKLPAFLGFDLRRAMQEKDAPRIVLMIDTYEALWRDAVHDAIYPRADQWVRTMLEEGTGVLVTIFSRDKLRWGEFDKVWENRLEQHLLGGLSEEDATRFLKTAGVRPDPICRRIVATSGGLPFYLDLAVSQFERLVANGETVTVDDFAGTPAELLHRFLDHLTEGERAELLLASYPDEVSESLLDALADAFPGDVAGINWQRFKSHSFIMLSDDGKASLHSLMREGLQALERRQRARHFRKVHLWLFERYDREAKPPEDERDIGERHDQALILAARHLAEADEERLISWILDSRWEKFNKAGRYLALSMALARASNAIRRPGTHPAPARAWEIDHHLAHLYQFMGRNEDAKELFERARANYDALKSNRDPIVYATILHAIADVCRDTGRNEEARRLYERALDIYKDEPGRYQRRYAEVLFSFGLLQAQPAGIEAHRYFQQAKDAFKAAVGDRDTDYAEFLNRLAFTHHEHKDCADAEALYKEALDIYRENLGDRHPYYADTLLYLSMCVQTRNKNTAEEGFAEAIAVYGEALGREHPKLGRGLHFQASLWIEDPLKLGPAKSQLEGAIAILKNALGNDHDWTKQAHRDLLRLQH